MDLSGIHLTVLIYCSFMSNNREVHYIGTKKCSGCGKVSYCSKNHQTMDWKACHKDECKDSDFEYSYQEDEENLSSLLLPQYEIIIEGDNEEVSDSDDEEGSEEVDEKKELEKIQELEKSGKVMSVKDLEDCSTEDEDQDKNWKRWQKVVKCASDQVIRYQRTGNPLWISTKNIPGLSVAFSRYFVPK